MLAKVEFAASKGATTVLLQGGHNPALPLDYYITLVRETRARFPQITPHFFTASEIRTMAQVSSLTVEDVLDRLWDAGQRTIPGGGAEVLSEKVRQRIEPKKGGPEAWLSVHRAAQKGFKSTANEMYGHVETVTTLDHFDSIRRCRRARRLHRLRPPVLQARQHPAREMDQALPGPQPYLRMLAVSRLYPTTAIQASWPPKANRPARSPSTSAPTTGAAHLRRERHKAPTRQQRHRRRNHHPDPERLHPAQRTTEYEILARH